jgi:hypothetical protein
MTPGFSSWRRRHFKQISDYRWECKSRDTESLIRQELARNAIAIRLEDATTGIPEPLYVHHPFEWDDDHHRCLRDFFLSGEVRLPNGRVRVAQNEGAHLAILRQLTSGLIYAGDLDNQAYWLSNRRLDELESVIDSVQGPVLVATFFRAEVSAMLKRFGRAARAFVGDTPNSERSKLIEDWNHDRIPILVAAPSAMGHGINLQLGSSRTVVWYTQTFDWAQRAQLNARLVRSGQTKTISIISLVADLGIDRAALTALAKKESGEQAVLAALDIRHRFRRQPEGIHVAA